MKSIVMGDWFQLGLIWLTSLFIIPLNTFLNEVTFEAISNLITFLIQVIILVTAILKFKQIKNNK
jgi:hypothetical protein